MKSVIPLVLVVVLSALAVAGDAPPVSFAYSTGLVTRIAKLPLKQDVYTLDAGKESYRLAFDSKSARTPKLLKWLEKGVKGKVRVKHRPGYIQFGEVKFLLVLDVEEVKVK